MARSQHDPPPAGLQAVGPCRPRLRCCLLKDCEQRFQPPHPLSRYCSPSCAAAARRHSRWLAAQRYRATQHGKEKRKQQAQRRRQRLRDQAQSGSKTREGHHYQKSTDFFPCHRPGCYQCFPAPARGVVKKFCNSACRRALRRVLRRERRWKQRPRQRVAEPLPTPPHPPPGHT